MKMTMSKDGVMRATIVVKFRISEQDRELIAFVYDRERAIIAGVDYTPKFRLATRKEIVEAIREGFGGEFWRDDDVNAHWKAKGK
jgi:hypothetical protein